MYGRLNLKDARIHVYAPGTRTHACSREHAHHSSPQPLHHNPHHPRSLFSLSALPQQQWFAISTKYETPSQRSRVRCRYARKGCKLSQDMDECVLEWKIKIIIKESTMYDIREYNILRMYASPFLHVTFTFCRKSLFSIPFSSPADFFLIKKFWGAS